MGIVEETLAEFTVDGKTCVIERNERGWIHLHLGDLRLAFSEDKYRDFAEIVLEARTALVEMKELDRT